MTFLITIYLIGCVVAYVVGKWGYMHTYPNEKWTIGLRIQLITYSLFSILTLIIFIASVIYHNWYNDKPAKW